jgi:hypothetical protein
MLMLGRNFVLGVWGSLSIRNGALFKPLKQNCDPTSASKSIASTIDNKKRMRTTNYLRRYAVYWGSLSIRNGALFIVPMDIFCVAALEYF